MSIKIYDGYRIKLTPHEIMKFAKDVQLLASHQWQERVLQGIVKETVIAYDKSLLSSTGIFESSTTAHTPRWMYHAEKIFKDIKDSTTLEYQPLQVIFFPSSSEWTYFILYGTEEEKNLILDSFPQIQEYGYWNNTDSYPEAVKSVDEWEQRKIKWFSFGLDSASPSETGVSLYTFNDATGATLISKIVMKLFNDEMMSSLIPDVHVRALNLKRSVYFALDERPFDVDNVMMWVKEHQNFDPQDHLDKHQKVFSMIDEMIVPINFYNELIDFRS